ncbi:MAG TPA: ferritin-like domain-containing protein [Candidatus Sulfotelmatobacter sp.]
MSSLRRLYVNELKYLYSAEMQLVNALPKLAKASSSTQLRQAFEEHLRQTAEQVSRLEEIFDELDEKPKGKKCLGMQGLIKEGANILREDYTGDLMDAAIIGAAQRAEHYEMAGYGAVKAMAQLLGQAEHVSLLEATLNEEKQTDRYLGRLAEAANTRTRQSSKSPIEPYQSNRAA